MRQITGYHGLRRRVDLRRSGPPRPAGHGGAVRLGAGLLAAVVLLLTGLTALFATAPAATALGRPDRPLTGDNCAYAGTAPPVDLPTGFPLPRGWHWPCTKATRPPARTHPPAPRPRPPRPTHRAPAPAPPRPAPPPPPPPPPRTSPPPPPPPTPHARPRPAPPPPPARRTVRRPPSPAPVLPRSYVRASHPPRSGRSIVTTTLLITAPAVLAGAALRPRSSSSSGSAGRRSS
ncbi:hypothetical protein [Streptomyces lydicus]|uniref:hypothetical protein n=1 Tax=Streptomyces lydicus TaxID=47763 RepID=UPI001011F526|nr:hypothetical protein [Streptomyces lydicus]UEG93265.1 hypothetical protein LJ741_23630 [Streptomyces lydicus]